MIIGYARCTGCSKEEGSPEGWLEPAQWGDHSGLNWTSEPGPTGHFMMAPAIDQQETKMPSKNLGLLSSIETTTASSKLTQMEQQASSAPTASFTDQPNIVQSILAESSHPTALVFHFLFRTAAIACYLFLWILVGDAFILNFVLTVLLLAMDFWTVKNVTGRLLVGLRWWTEPREDGTTAWIFESKPANNFRPNPIDYRLFWWSLYLYPAVWVGLAFVSLLRLNFSWLIVTGMAVVLCGTNLVGYTKCDKDARKKLMSGLGNRFMSSFIGTKIEAILS